MSGLLLQAFDRLAQAPGGVARLRELILSLAVQGRLVAQSERDEPVAVVLQEIQLAKGGALPRRRSRATDTGDAPIAPFALPDTWDWVRLGEVTDISGGVTLGRKGTIEQPMTLPYLRVANVQRWNVLCDDLKTITIGRAELARYQLRAGDLLITEGGDWDKVGRTAIWRDEVAVCLHQNHVFKARGLTPRWNPEWAQLYLNSPIARDYFASCSKQTTNLASINMTQLKACAFPLPPVAEQARIVARVDELMRLCDALEAKGRLEAEQHTRLLDTLLGTLTDSATPEELAANWQRVAEHFDQLLDRPEAVDALEQTVLQLAVRGLLVPQDTTERTPPADSNALRRSGSDPIDEAELPYDVPSNWQWVRLGSVADLINGDRGTNYPNKSEYVATGLPFINTGHIEPDGTLSHESMHYLTRKKFESLRGGKTLPGDLVYCLRGATLGKTAIVEYPEGAIASSLVIIRLDQAIDRKYMYYYLTGPMGKSLVRRFDNGSAQPNLAANSVKRYVVPLPPAAEQRRIVARVEELRRLCAELRKRLSASQATQSRLAETLVESVASA